MHKEDKPTESKKPSVQDASLAYAILFAQEQTKNPELTPDGFRAFLRETVSAGAKQAREQHGKKEGSK